MPALTRVAHLPRVHYSHSPAQDPSISQSIPNPVANMIKVSLVYLLSGGIAQAPPADLEHEEE